MADHGSGEVDHPPRDPTAGEEVAGQDEERDRHDLELLDAGEHLQCHRFHRHRGEGEHEGQHGQAERDTDRHADRHQRDQHAEYHCSIHDSVPPALAVGRHARTVPAGMFDFLTDLHGFAEPQCRSLLVEPFDMPGIVVRKLAAAGESQ